MLARLMRLLERRGDRDGRDRAGEAERVRPAAPGPEGAIPAGNRRDLFPGCSPDEIERGLACKVLHGWLQNQHQTLVPLTLRLQQLPPDHIRTLIRFAALAFLAATTLDSGRREATIRWLRSIGAEDGAIDDFSTALERPESLSLTVGAIRASGLEPYAYAAAVVAADQRDPAGRLFANYAAARFELPADAIRSIDRRYRR